MSIKDELMAIQKANPDGLLKVKDAWRWAKENPNSELHNAIEWDVEEAAKQYQFSQIRRLITIHIVTPEHKPEIVSVISDRVQPGGGYRVLQEAMAVPFFRDQILKDVRNQLFRLEEHYNYLTELAEVWSAVKNMREHTDPAYPPAQPQA